MCVLLWRWKLRRIEACPLPEEPVDDDPCPLQVRQGGEEVGGRSRGHGRGCFRRNLSLEGDVRPIGGHEGLGSIGENQDELRFSVTVGLRPDIENPSLHGVMFSDDGDFGWEVLGVGSV